MISGWAVDPNAVYRYQVDAAFPLSDHADYDRSAALRRTGATEARPDAARIRRGIRARSARARHRSVGVERGEPAGADAAQRAPRSRRSRRARSRLAAVASVPSEFHAFAEVGEAIAATRRSSRKSDCSRNTCARSNRSNCRSRRVYFTGKAISRKAICARCKSAGRSFIARCSARADSSDAEFRRIASSHGDAGKTAFEALEGRTDARAIPFGESQEFFEDAAQSARPAGQD